MTTYRNPTTSTVRIYTAEFDGEVFTEHLETRVNTRLVADEPTGVTYPTFRAMEAGTAAKNRILWNEMARV